MTKKQAQEKAEKLRKLIDHHRYLYHVLDKQEISEQALDSLKKELFDIEQRYPDLITSYSPTQRIGGKPLDKFNKIKRKKPMLSLNDVFSKEDVYNWLKRIKKIIKREDKLSFFCELKIDGLAFELIYNKKILQTGSTRGDGLIGEDVTENLKTINSIPLKINETKNKKIKQFLDKEIIVRGEAFLNRKDFDKINKERQKKGLELYANPRNVAAGSIRQLDSKIAASRKIDSFVYDLITDFKVESHQEKHEILRDLGFKVNSYEKHCQKIEEVFDFYQKIINVRDSLPYEIDGIVITVNDNKIFNELGFIGKAPRGSVAYKFPLKQTTTIVKDVVFQVGRTGVLTPVAVLKPVDLSGATISRATLHNEDEIKRLDVRIGDTVIIGRAGDVIPDIIKVIKDLRNNKEKKIVFPKQCFSCKSDIKKIKKTSTIFYCPNKECFARKKEYFSYFVSRKGFNFQGLGEQIINKFITEKIISSPADLFFLEKKDIEFLPGFQDKLANKIIESIKSKKTISLSKFIYSLGIENVGQETATLLANNFTTLNNLKKASLNELLLIKDIGEITAESIYQWFRDKKNIEFLDKIKRAGVKTTQEKNKSQKLYQKTFVITGTLKTMSREQAINRIKQLSGKVSQSISLKTNYIIVGDNPGTKLTKAKKLKIKQITEKEFIEMTR